MASATAHRRELINSDRAKGGFPPSCDSPRTSADRLRPTPQLSFVGTWQDLRPRLLQANSVALGAGEKFWFMDLSLRSVGLPLGC
jgi:hypothetical protein